MTAMLAQSLDLEPHVIIYTVERVTAPPVAREVIQNDDTHEGC